MYLLLISLFARRYMMSMPTLRQQLYSSLSESGDSSVREAMMNVMQATFVTQQSSDADVQSKSRQVFNTLFSHHFKEAVKVNSYTVTLRADIIQTCKTRNETEYGME